MADVAKNPQEPVPLDTIPISPDGAMTDSTNGATNGGGNANGPIVTVFDDPANFNVKHQLQHTWTLWFTKPPSGKQDWNELLKEVISFNSVEEFWGIYVSLGLFRGLSRSRQSPLTPTHLRTTLRLPLSSPRSQTIISSSRAYDRSGRTSRTSMVDDGPTHSKAARPTTRPG